VMVTPFVVRVTPVSSGNPGMPPGCGLLRCGGLCPPAAKDATASRPAKTSNRSVFAFAGTAECRPVDRRISRLIAVSMACCLELLQCPLLRPGSKAISVSFSDCFPLDLLKLLQRGVLIRLGRAVLRLQIMVFRLFDSGLDVLRRLRQSSQRRAPQCARTFFTETESSLGMACLTASSVAPSTGEQVAYRRVNANPCNDATEIEFQRRLPFRGQGGKRFLLAAATTAMPK